MKNFLATIALCSAVLLICSFVIVRSVGAGAAAGADDEDIISVLLQLPAPPAPNPLQKAVVVTDRPATFYSKDNPPPDNAPIEDILDYWAKQTYGQLAYNIVPTPVVLDRIAAAMEIDSTKITSYLNYLKDSPRGIASVRMAYDRAASEPAVDPDEKSSYANSSAYYGEGGDYYPNPRNNLKTWLIMNDPSFSADLEPLASAVKDTENGYIENDDELLALAKNDWNRARPMIDKMYADGSQPASKTLATWALYKKAMDDGSLSDADKYREELKGTVTNKQLSPGVRDLALDALSLNQEWSGRDDWYYSLMEDETLLDMDGYTGLTTLMTHSKPGKYKAKMIKLLQSNNPNVRSAAARNLGLEAAKGDTDAIEALLPWLENPAWIKDVADTRGSLVRALAEVKMPQSVPGLIAIMNERVENKEEDDDEYDYEDNSNSVASIRRAAADAISIVKNAANSASNSAAYKGPRYFYPFKYQAISALDKQASPIAVPALRRLYNSDDEGYYGMQIVKAIYACGGFSIPEQIDSLEYSIRSFMEKQAFFDSSRITTTNTVEVDDDELEITSASNVYSGSNISAMSEPTSKADQLRATLGMMVISDKEPSDQLVAATIQKINSLEAREPATAALFRQLVSNWNTRAAFAMQLADLKAGKGNAASVLNLLGDRKTLRETQPTDVYDARSGVPNAAGIATCILEDSPSYTAILNDPNTEVKAAFLACSRLIRIELPVQMVAANLNSADKRLALASQLYLESEDSPEARNILFAHFPGQAKITGSRIAFAGANGNGFVGGVLELFSTVDARFRGKAFYSYYLNSGPFEKRDKRFQAEVLANNDLLGIYVYGKNVLRIYADRVTYDMEEDDSRSYQRVISPQDFEYLKSYLARNQVNDIKAFVGCNSRCRPDELLMLGKAGGRRIFSYTDQQPEFFKGLDEFFATLEAKPGQLRYAAAEKLPGFQVLFADPRLTAGTVWADGDDVRFFATDVAARRSVDEQVRAETQRYYATFAESEDEPDYEYTSSLAEKRKFEGLGWYKFSPQGIGINASQPAEVEMIPLKTGRTIDVFDEPWKSRGGGIELRTDDKALYKVSGGNETKIADGNFIDPIISPDGRWAIARVVDEEYESKLMRIDLSTRRMYEVESTTWLKPLVWVPGVNKFLLGAGSEYYEGYPGSSPRNLMWLDAVSGKVTNAAGMLMPLLQQTFRPLQKASAGGYWAAIPLKKANETRIGTYDPKSLKFTSKMTVPSIQFDSMAMWVDEKTSLIYFVYDGHLLRVPMPK